MAARLQLTPTVLDVEARNLNSRLFPLPLAPFEEYMLLEDQPASPMNFHLRLRFQGHLQPEQFQSAAIVAAARHPLLGALLETTAQGQRQWIPAPQPGPAIQWCTSPAAAALPHTPPFDLSREPGLRLWVSQGPHGSDLLIQLHHASCDGVGGMGFVRDLLLAYDQQHHRGTKQTLRLPAWDVSQLPQRASFGLERSTRKRWMQQPRGLTAARDFLYRTVASLGPSATSGDDSRPSTYPTTCSAALTLKESSWLRRLTHQQAVTVNDLLLRDLLLTLNVWRERHEPAEQAEWLRVMVPVNLRTAAEQTLPAANVVSLVFLDRRVADLQRPTRLLRGIHNEMLIVKRERLALAFVLWLEAARGQLAAIVSDLAARGSRATSLLTNLGTVLQNVPLARDRGRLVVGDTVLENVELLAPRRMRTSAAFAAVHYAGRLNVTLHYDPRVLPPGLASVLLADFMRRLRLSLETMLAVEASEIVIAPVSLTSESVFIGTAAGCNR